MKTYDKYKSSGIDWIGDIPEHWEYKRIKRLSQVKRGASPRPIDDPKYFDDDGEFAWVRIADVSASERYLETSTQRLSELGSSLSVKRFPNDFFLSIAGTVGKPIITKIQCCIHDGFVWFPDLKINPEYLYYIFCTGLPYKGLGKLGTQLNLNTDTVGEIFVPIPTFEEIEIIVNHLDEKTAQIDKLISEKRRLIELLKEERLGVINQAVTRGINPHAKLKPSGIDWLGEIPEHWEVKKLKFVCSLLKDGTHLPPPRVQDGLPLLSVRNLVNGNYIQFLDDDSKISEEDFEQLEKAFEVKEHDILLAIVGATMGKVSLVPKMSKFTIQRSVGIFRAIEEIIHYKFLFYFFLNDSFQSILWNNTGFSAQPGIYLGALANFSTSCPPLAEQKQIVEFIETATGKIDATIATIEKEIELLQEYRTALISEVVTGKIKVC